MSAIKDRHAASTVLWVIICLLFAAAPPALSLYIPPAQPPDADLTALAGLSTTGLVTRTGSATYATRTLTGTADRLTVTQGDGVAGDPTADVNTAGDVLGTANRLTVTGGSNVLVGADAVDVTLDVSTAGDILGTSNQVTVTGGDNVLPGADAVDVTLALPQDIHTGASPTFVNVNLTQNAATLQYRSVSLNTAAITGMFATPVELIPAPGANKFIVVEAVVIDYTYGGTAFTGGGTISFVYGTSGSNASGTMGGALFTTGTTDRLGWSIANGNNSNTRTSVVNQAVNITNATGAFATGNGSAVVKLVYRVMDL